MIKKDSFFSFKNTVKNLNDHEENQTANYIAAIEAFARTTYSSIYIIDYKTKGFEYVSENPLFLSGHTPEEVRLMGYDFYLKYVPEDDVKLLLKINAIGFDYYETILKEERKEYTISYDFQLKNQEGKLSLINQKLTPLFLTDEGKIWKAICIVSLSNQRQSGNITVSKNGDDSISMYDLGKECWIKAPKKRLTEREKEILQLSLRAYTINEIGEQLFITPDTIKFHRKKIFEKLEVSNITEAISFATMNKLI